MFVDDRLVRIGSANFSKRSMGVDTECDVTVDAGGDARLCHGVRRVRDRLLGEHLGMRAEDVAREIESRGSIGALIDARRDADHTLVRVDVPAESDPPAAVLEAAADPLDPLDVSGIVESIVEPALEAEPDRAGGPRAWVPALAAAGAALGGLAVLARRERRMSAVGAWPATGRAAALVLGAAVGLRTWLYARQLWAVESRHRARAEFG